MPSSPNTSFSANRNRSAAVPSETRAILEQLRAEAERLARIQRLFREGAPCSLLLSELDAADQAINAIQVDLARGQIANSLSILQAGPGAETCLEEIRKIFAVLSFP